MNDQTAFHMMVLGIILMFAGLYVSFALGFNKLKDGADNSGAIIAILGGLALNIIGMLVCVFI